MRRLLLFSLCLVISATCLGLGAWQLSRLSTRRAANRAALSGRSLPPLVVTDPTGRLEPNRRASVEGTLDEAHEFVLRGRVVQGTPAVQIVTPLRMVGRDTAILLNRGYVPAPDAVDPGKVPWSEADRRAFHGVLLQVPDRGDGAPMRHANRETWKGLDLTAMRARLPYPISSVYLIAEPDSGSLEHTPRGRAYPLRAEPPPLSDGPHLMYAVQWFGIAAAVSAFGVIFVLRGKPAQRIDT